MKVLNLIREFEMQRMKESETIKEYSNKLLGKIINPRSLTFYMEDNTNYNRKIK